MRSYILYIHILKMSDDTEKCIEVLNATNKCERVLY